MNSRERVLTALEHKEPDRIPIGFGSHHSDGIMAIAYARLKDYLGITSGDIYVYDVPQQLAIVEKPVLDHFNVDIVELGRGFALDDSYWTNWVLPDGTPCKIPAHIRATMKEEKGNWYICSNDGMPIAVQRKSMLYFDQIHWPLMNSNDRTFDNLESKFNEIMWFQASSPPAPIEYDVEGLRKLKQGAKNLRESTDRAIIGVFGGSLNETGHYFFRTDNYMMMMAADPKCVHRFLDKLMEIYLINLEKYLSATGDYIDIILFGGDDLGMQTGPMMSKAMYDEFFKPRHKQLFTRAKELANVKVMLHSCGSIYKLLPSLIEAGVEILNPVQISATDMDATRLKREFGKDITFAGGGCDTQYILPNASPEEVARHTHKQCEILSREGGFIFEQVHNIMANVSPENIVAMFNAVNEK